MPADEGPLSRWSRRKATARRRGGAAPVIPDAPSAVPAVVGEAVSSVDNAAPASASPDSEVTSPPADDAAALDLPDIESLGPDSDFTAFMKEGVPTHLRNLALRKLWASDPVLANVDGLVDYGEDFTDIKSGIFEAVKTVLDSGDEEGSPVERPAVQPDQPETARMDDESEGETGADDLAEDDRATTAEEPENRPDSADDAGNAKA